MKPISNVAIFADRKFKDNLTFYDQLAERNIQFDILIDVYCGAKDVFRGYDLILVPGIKWISEEIVLQLGKYVRSGGRLMVTGKAGTVEYGSYQMRSRWLFEEMFSRSKVPEDTLEVHHGAGTAIYWPHQAEKIIERDAVRHKEFFACLDGLAAPLLTLRKSPSVTGRLARCDKGQLYLCVVNYGDRPAENVVIEIDHKLFKKETPEAFSHSLDPGVRKKIQIKRSGESVQLVVPTLDVWQLIILE